MIPIPFDKDALYDVVEVKGNRYLFTNMRIDRKTLPEGAVAYDVGDECDGEFCRIQKFVMVNHWGTIIGFDQIEEAENGIYWCDEEHEDGAFTGEYMSWDTFNVVEKNI